MKDDGVKAGWGERTVNKVAKLAISRLVEAERIDIWVKTTLPQAMRGEVDGITIHLQGFSAQENLQIESFRLQIGQVTILPKLALQGTIQLLEPSTGELTLILREKQLSDFLRKHLSNERSQTLTPAEQSLQNYTVHDLSAAFLDGNQMQFALTWTTASSEFIQSSMLLTTPDMTPDGQGVHLCVQSISGQDVPAELIAAILSPIDEILSLHDFRHRGTSFQIQQLEITPEKLTLHADATVHQFPSR